MTIRPLLLAAVLLSGCGADRAVSSSPDLERRAAAVSQQQLALTDSVLATVVEALAADQAAGRPPCLDVLMLSGGGSWGAFGAGFLHGWCDLPSDHPLAMPRFDLVSGVSTGALIAPFALIGTRQSLARIEGLYRGSQEDWLSMRSLVNLLGAPAIFETEGLDAVIRSQVDADLARQLVAAQEVEHRQAFSTSSDLDLGRPVLWRLGDQARKGLAGAGYDSTPLYNALRASAAIPGAFSPVSVDGALHVDGALYGQIHVLADMRVVDRLLADWRHRAGPGAPLPKIRYWVVLNNRIHVERKTIQPPWSEVALRSVELMLNAQVIAPLHRLALFAEGMRLKHGLMVEIRWVQIPSDWTMPAGVNEFHPSVTNGLSDLGLRLGRDPASWQGVDRLGMEEREGNVHVGAP
jgi:hypothetical protein